MKPLSGKCTRAIKRIKCLFKDMAVLYRTNTGARLLVAKLMEYNIPFRMKDSVPNLFATGSPRTFLPTLRQLWGRLRGAIILESSIGQAVYLPQMLTGTGHFLETLKASYAGKDWAWSGWTVWPMIWKVWGKMNPYGAVNYIRYGLGYDNFLIEYARDHRVKEEDLLDIVTELQDSAKNYESFQDWFAYMEDYGLKLKEKSRAREGNCRRPVLSTMHSAKGLEYSTVLYY